ncbi:hypothetical protein IH414_17670 [Acinetobacter baumannii]|uniref:hypothetical protein n=1 Tax=Acinetobacter baumannii TaxID=470 RepID=UPI001E4FF120|nr:hypothetical protein [Acinetobacter baumannii]MCD7370384.1 hypothetical protein [Acinetobacter baumannii]MCD7388215.1 hypothetical protein [Acinetobacter baumannii]MCD7388845.1 hypothetical protein [Acinetobacter baumannii]MCD7401659.1 hypothetical protein [Acinetobacter baumannii]
MDNYKIKVKDEAESKEAQELFVKLGFEKTGFSCDEFPCYLATWEGGFSDYVLDSLSVSRERKELTLPQLRDLVVLKRGDVKDATHRDKQQNSIYLTSDKVIYYWDAEWLNSAINKSNDYENYIANSLTPITQPQDPALISGADAELVAQAKKFITSDHLNRFEAAEAHLEGHPVQFMLANGDFIDITSDTTLGIFEKDGGYSFRLKPQTIKVELELPKPFEPKLGDIYWFLSPFYSTGYDHCTFTNDSADKLHVQYGAYRSEDDVKKAVEQLRKIRGTNS